MTFSNIFTIFFLASLQQEDYDYGDEAYYDLQPLNCSTTESIKGGHVSYSQVQIDSITAVA